MCLKGFCPQCGSLQKLHRCLHLDSTHEIGKTLASLGKYKLVIYGDKDGKELKRCELVKSDVCVADFMKCFFKYKLTKGFLRWPNHSMLR